VGEQRQAVVFRSAFDTFQHGRDVLAGQCLGNFAYRVVEIQTVYDDFHVFLLCQNGDKT